MIECHPARWWNPVEGTTDIQCHLCPRHCRIADGACGYCGARQNQHGKLFSLAYGHPVSIAIDPVEKKPFARFMPGTRTFSFGTFGCNLGCVFCQNDTLSRGRYAENREYQFVSPERMVETALQHHCPSISYTYNEPTIFAEYACDIARLAHQAGLKNLLVSNGYIVKEAAEELYPLMDAANIDMKGFTQDYYGSMCAARLTPVLEAIDTLHRLGKHLEITMLIVPGKNDSDEAVTAWLDWAEAHLGHHVPLHFTAYHPAYKCTIPPTQPDVLRHIQEMARARGFQEVFLGNI